MYRYSHEKLWYGRNTVLYSLLEFLYYKTANFPLKYPQVYSPPWKPPILIIAVFVVVAAAVAAAAAAAAADVPGAGAGAVVVVIVVVVVVVVVVAVVVSLNDRLRWRS